MNVDKDIQWECLEAAARISKGLMPEEDLLGSQCETQ